MKLANTRGRGRPSAHFGRHLLEMTLAMMLGMCVLGMVFRAIHSAVFGGGFADAWQEHVALAAFAMAFNMTLPMVLWMRVRGHSWERGGEMALAMVIPAVPLLLLWWSAAIPSGAVLPVQMTLMLPSMLAAMLYRFDEYNASKPAGA